MNTVAQLVIEMSANMSSLQQDMNKAQKVVEGSMAKVQSAAQGAMKALTGIGVGLSVAGLAAFIRGAIDAADEMSKLSQKTGLAVQDVAGLQLAYRQSGLAAEVLQTSIAKMSKAMADGSDAFTAMGVSVRNQDGTLKSTRQVLGEVSDKFAGYKDGAEKTALAMEIFGKSGADLIPLLNGGAGALEEFDAMAQKLGLTISEQTAKDAEKFNDTLDLVGQGMQGIGRQVAAQLLPTLSTLAGQFFDSATSGDTLKSVADGLGFAFKALYSIGVGVVQAFKTVGLALGGVGAAIAAILNGDFGQVSSIVSSMASDISASWQQAGAGIKTVWDGAGNSTVEAMASVANQAAKTAPEVSGVGKAAKAAADDFAKLIAKLTAKETGFDADFAKNFELIASGGKKAGLAIAEIIRLQDLYIAQQPVMVKYQKDKAAADESAAKFVKQLAEEAQKEVDAEFKVAESLTAKAQAQEFANLAFDKGRSAVEELALVEMQRRLTMLDSTESVIPGMVLATEQQIDAQKRLIKALKEEEALQQAKKDQEAFKGLIDGVDKAGFDGLFNGSLKGISKLIESVKLLGKLQTDGEKARLGAAKQYGETSEEYAAALKGIEQDKQRVSLQTYSAMAGAAKGFFEEGSRGYKAMEIAETSFALAAAVSAIASQGKGDPYTAIPRMLAVAGLLAQLGIQLNGLSGASAKPVTNEGKGTVFGDSDAKSQSIQNSIKLLAETSQMGLRYSAQMANSLKNIEAAFAGVTNLLLRNGQITKLESSIATGYSANGTSKFVDGVHSILRVFEPVLGGFLQKMFGGLVNKLFGTKTSVIGSGIFGGPQSFGDIESIGFQGSYYADVEKKKKFLGITTSTSQSTVLSALDAELSDQFTKIFSNMGDGILSASKVFGLRTEGVTAALESYIVDIGKIDLRGLNGEQIQEKLSAVFGAEFDRMAAAIIPGLESIQRVGEGYSETMVRAANQLEVVDFTFSRLGGTLSLVSKNTDIFLQKLSQPGAQATPAGINQAVLADQLVQQFGGLEQFTQSTEAFYQVFYSRQEQTRDGFAAITSALDGLGVALPASDRQWRDITTSIDVSTEAGRELFESMVNFGPAFHDMQQQLLDAAGISGSAIADVIRDGAVGRISQSDAGTKLADMLTNGINDALASGVSEQISTSMLNEIVTPMLQSIALGGDLMAAVSQDNLDNFVQTAQARLSGLATVLNSPAVQQAMQQLQQGIGGITSAMGGLASSLQTVAAAANDATRYTANAADIARANDPWIQAAEVAQRAADDARKAWESVSKTILDEIKRLRGGSVLGESRSFLESQFAIGNAQARAGDVAALAKLPEISRALEEATRKTSSTSLEFKTAIARQAATLEQTVYGGGAGAAYQSTNGGAAVVVPSAVVPVVGAAGAGVFADVAQEIRSLKEQVRQQGDRIAELQTENNRRTKDISDTLTRVTRAGSAVVTVPLS